MPPAYDLWKEFNLAENNPDPGGGLLYFFRYDRDHLDAQQESVIRALDRLGASPTEYNGGIKVSVSPRNAGQTAVLLEELSVINEAIEYSAGLTDVHSVDSFANQMMGGCYELLNQRNLPDAYGLVTVAIPQAVRDLRIADTQSGVLTRSDRKSLETLTQFGRQMSEKLNRSNRLVIFG